MQEVATAWSSTIYFSSFQYKASWYVDIGCNNRTTLFRLITTSIVVEVCFVREWFQFSSSWCNSCKAMQYMDAILELVQFPCLACELPATSRKRIRVDHQSFELVFAAMRIYGLLDGKYLLACFVCALNLIPFFADAVRFTRIMLGRNT